MLGLGPPLPTTDSTDPSKHARSLLLMPASFCQTLPSFVLYRLLCTFSFTSSILARAATIPPSTRSLVLCLSDSFHARSWSLTLYSSAFRLRSECAARAVTLLDNSIPQGSRYFPFSARPVRVQGPTVVPLVHGASFLCMHRYRSTSVPLTSSSPRSSAVTLVHGAFSMSMSKVRNVVVRPLCHWRFLHPDLWGVFRLLTRFFVMSSVGGGWRSRMAPHKI